MYRSILRLISALLIPTFLFCGCSQKEEDTGAGYLFTCTIPANPDCLDPQYTSGSTADAVLVSIMEGLVRIDETGTVVCAGAESYTISQDGLTYIFNLRSDCCWYSAGMAEGTEIPVTAQDYVFAFRRLLSPETRSPHAADFTCLENAVMVMTGLSAPEELGVSALNDSTVVFELEHTDAEFPALLAQPCAVPCNEEFFLSTNGRYGLDKDTVLCNGPFCLTQWVYDPYGGGNFLTMRKNRTYYGADDIYPSSLQYNIMRTQESADEDFSAGLSDVILTDTPPRTLGSSGGSASAQSAVYGLIFNPENELLQNMTLRRALAFGISRSAVAAQLSDDLSPAYGLIPPGVTLLGRSYRELFADEQLVPGYDPTQARSLFQEAVGTEGSGAVNTLQIMVPSELDAADAMLAVCQRWQDIFGYYIGIETVSAEEYDRRLAAGEYSIALYGIRPERNSCRAALSAYTTQAKRLGLDDTMCRGLLTEVSKQGQLADAAPLYGDAEQTLADSLCFIPLFYKNSYLVWTGGNTDLFFDPFTRCIDFRQAKHFS